MALCRWNGVRRACRKCTRRLPGLRSTLNSVQNRPARPTESARPQGRQVTASAGCASRMSGQPARSALFRTTRKMRSRPHPVSRSCRAAARRNASGPAARGACLRRDRPGRPMSRAACQASMGHSPRLRGAGKSAYRQSGRANNEVQTVEQRATEPRRAAGAFGVRADAGLFGVFAVGAGAFARVLTGSADFVHTLFPPVWTTTSPTGPALQHVVAALSR